MIGKNSSYRNPVGAVNQMQSDRFLQATRNNVKSLTPAGRRMLVRLVKTFNANKGKSITRRDVALILGRVNITPHDCNLLKTLCDNRLLDSKRVALYTKDDRPCGFEYRYSMNENTGWALNTMLMSRNKK